MDRTGWGALRRRWELVRSRRDAGYSVVEAVVSLPVLIFFILLVVQYALLWHARHVAQAAAQDAARASAQYNAAAATGRGEGASYLRQVAPNLLTGTSVMVNRSTTTVSVHVQGSVLAVVPLAHFRVSETVTVPVERYVPTPGR